MRVLRAAVAAGLQPCGSRGGLKPAAYCLVWLLAQTSLLACPVCFQVEDGQAAAGVRAAVLVLAGVTTAVLAGFGVFIRRLVRRP